MGIMQENMADRIQPKVKETEHGTTYVEASVVSEVPAAVPEEAAAEPVKKKSRKSSKKK